MSETIPAGDPVDLEGIRVFVRVAELGSFRRAADALGVPRSTVSRRVAALEATLGARLLQRTTRTVSLTDAGAAYLLTCRPALATLESASRGVTNDPASPRGTLRLTTAVTFGERFLAPLLAEYLRACPQVAVEVLLADRYVDLVQEGFDVAIRAGTLADSSLVAREVARARVGCFASPAYLRARGTPKRPRDLAAHDAVAHPSMTPGGRWAFVVDGRRVAVAVKPRVTANGMPLALELCRAGLGVARLPAPFAAEALADGSLVEVLGRHALPPAAMHVVFPSARHLPARVRAFIDLAVQHLDGLSLSVARPRRRG